MSLCSLLLGARQFPHFWKLLFIKLSQVGGDGNNIFEISRREQAAGKPGTDIPFLKANNHILDPEKQFWG